MTFNFKRLLLGEDVMVVQAMHNYLLKYMFYSLYVTIEPIGGYLLVGLLDSVHHLLTSVWYRFL